MSPLAHFIQVVIVAAAVVGVLFMLAAQAIADYLNARPSAEDVEQLDDAGAEWDRARDRWLDEQAGAA